MDRTFWRDLPVLVTGHTGFKGAWATRWLARAGARVSGLARDPLDDGAARGDGASLFTRARIGELLANDLRGDVNDLATVTDAVARTAPAVVIHMAAQSLVRASYRAPVETFATNVMGTVHVLEAVRRVPGVCAVLVVTSDKCYENRESGEAFREGDAMGGSDPYSASKGCAELVTRAYAQSFFAHGTDAHAAATVASARAGNVIGGGDVAPDRLLPDARRAFSAGRALSVRHPDAVRPWQHVLEPLDGYFTLCEKLVRDGKTFEGPWNFGPLADESRTVREVLDVACATWGDGARWVHEGGATLHEAHTLRLDPTQARTRLRWHSRLAFDEAVQWTVAFDRSLGRGADARALMDADIARYETTRPAPVPG